MSRVVLLFKETSSTFLSLDPGFNKTDLTDNKTLIALLGWIAAAFAIFRSKRPGLSALIAAVVLLVVYLIPHSMFGSELDYNKIDAQKNRIETSQKKVSLNP